jgi:hypothetical protein
MRVILSCSTRCWVEVMSVCEGACVLGQHQQQEE